MIKFKHKGDFSKTINYMNSAKKAVDFKMLEKYAQQGVNALKAATPVDTGVTANSWYYEIEKTKNSITIKFNNSNIVRGVPIAIILQYGHGTRNGGYVTGRDYINPAIQPIFEKITNDAWKEVTKL